MLDQVSLFIGLATAAVGAAAIFGVPMRLGGLVIQGKHARVFGAILLAPLVLPFALTFVLNAVAMAGDNPELVEETADFVGWLGLGLPVVCLIAALLYIVDNQPRRPQRQTAFPGADDIQRGGYFDAVRYRAINEKLARMAAEEPAPEPDPEPEPTPRRPDHFAPAMSE